MKEQFLSYTLMKLQVKDDSLRQQIDMDRCRGLVKVKPSPTAWYQLDSFTMEQYTDR